MKNINKKPLFAIGAIFLGVILVVVIVAIVRSCGGPGTNYSKVEGMLITSTQKYLQSEGQVLPTDGTSKEVTAEELASAGMMKPMSDLLVDVSCTGKVKVYNNGGQYLYIPNLVCAEYKTKHIKEVVVDENIIENVELAQSEYTSGLYTNDDGSYTFKGKNPKNYVTYGGTLWRILDINSNGDLRLIKVAAEKDKVSWDTKYNAEAKKTYGINEYKFSTLLESLNNKYKAYPAEIKQHLLPHDVCIAKRASKDLVIDRAGKDCAEKLEGQYVSVVSLSDFGTVSLDENCKNVVSQSCINFNYLSDILTSAWTTTGAADDTYRSVVISNGLATLTNASKRQVIHIVISLSGEEIYSEGNGTIEKPYVVSYTVKKK